MTRGVAILAVLAALRAGVPFLAAQTGEGKRQPAPQPPQSAPAEPPEEDEDLKPKEYSFNPIQAQKELSVGNFYFKKKSYKAAAGRYEEAVKWNPGFADAYLRLGEAREKLGLKKEAAEAYRAFLENAPDDKRAGEVRKKIGASGKS